MLYPGHNSEVRKTLREPKRISRLEWIQKNIQLDGRPISYYHRPWWALPISIEHMKIGGEYRRKIVIVAGRQVEKTSNLSNGAIANANSGDGWVRSLYVAPSYSQVKIFSKDKIDAVVRNSPRIAHRIKKDEWSVSEKVWAGTESRMYFRSAFLTADRSRGIQADELRIDEAQDILTRVIPILQECTTHCAKPGGPIHWFTGTPKTVDTALEHLFARQSTRRQWRVRCNACRKWNVLGENNIGPQGLICSKAECRKPINPLGELIGGQRVGVAWVAETANAPMEGFRIPQLLLPYSDFHNPEVFRRMWNEILYKSIHYDRPRFFNEVLGISYDSGEKPVTMEEIKACCVDQAYLMKVLGQPRRLNLDAGDTVPSHILAGFKFAGVDWGGGSPSRTTYVNTRYCPDGVQEVFFFKFFNGYENATEIFIPAIKNYIQIVNPTYIGMDYGFGFGINSEFIKLMGFERAFQYMHSGNQRDRLKFDASSNVFVTGRTAVLTDVFTLIKTGRIRFLCTFQELEESGAAADLIASSRTKTRTGMLQYDHPPGTTDDFLHAVTYADLAGQVKFPRVLL